MSAARQPARADAMSNPAGDGVRLAEIVACLSLATDLGLGQPMEWALSSCLLGLRLGEAVGLSDDELHDVYYLTLLRFIGCTSDTAEMAELVGDEIAMYRDMTAVHMGTMLDGMPILMRHTGLGRSPLERARMFATMFATAPAKFKESPLAHCEVAQMLAARLGFKQPVQDGLWQISERWDGKGHPRQVKGEAIARPVRVMQVAMDAVLFHRLGGIDQMVEMLRKRAGGAYDPTLAERVCRDARTLLADIGDDSSWDVVLASEPGRRPRLTGAQIDRAGEVLADFGDLKSSYTLEHSRRVAALAEAAARRCGLPESEVAAARRAGFVHDLGQVGITSSIWEKAGPLSESEWERVRLHPYYTERILARSRSMAHVGNIGALHHERLDGSGYHRSLPAGMLPPAARIVAAADVYQALTEERPYRAARSPEQAADHLRSEARAGRLDGEAASAVLAAAGHRVSPARREMVAGLSERELDVLRLLARGHSNREMAERLSISAKTVGHHVQHIYDKIGVSSRAAATLFAMQHDLLAAGT